MGVGVAPGSSEPVECVLQVGFPSVDKARLGAVGHPFAARKPNERRDAVTLWASGDDLGSQRGRLLREPPAESMPDLRPQRPQLEVPTCSSIY